MKPETHEWVEKAEGDLKVARREGQAVEPVHEAVCFHAQQCAEKYLKAWLEEHNLAFPRIHDLIALLTLSGGLLPELDPFRALSIFGIAARYPGITADQHAAKEALTTAEDVRIGVRGKLGLPWTVLSRTVADWDHENWRNEGDCSGAVDHDFCSFQGSCLLL